jgi:hypothetical protein
VRFVGLVQAAIILITGCDGKLIAAGAQAARPRVLPLHENLKLVGVPDDAHPPNAHLALLDLISLIRDLVVPQHDFSPDFARQVAEGVRPLRRLTSTPLLLD